MEQGLNAVVILATLLMQLTVAMAWYGPLFGETFSRIVYGRRQTPKSPLLPLVTSVFSTGLLLVLVNKLALEFEITTWQHGLKIAGVLWMVDACLNVRHYMFEHRPFKLFLLHSGYHMITLGMACGLLATFGTR